MSDGLHCYHHTHDSDDDACVVGGCSDYDYCIHCECCCTCLGCEYGPRNGMLMWPEGNAEIAALGGDGGRTNA